VAQPFPSRGSAGRDSGAAFAFQWGPRQEAKFCAGPVRLETAAPGGVTGAAKPRSSSPSPRCNRLGWYLTDAPLGRRGCRVPNLSSNLLRRDIRPPIGVDPRTIEVLSAVFRRSSGPRAFRRSTRPVFLSAELPGSLAPASPGRSSGSWAVHRAGTVRLAFPSQTGIILSSI